MSLTALTFASVRCSSSPGGTGSGNGDADGGAGAGSSSGGGTGSGSGIGGSGSSGGSGSIGGSGSGGGTGDGGSNTGSGSGGASSSGSSSGVIVSTGDGGTGGAQSVLQRGNDVYRRATFTAPALTTAAVTTMAPATTFDTNATFPANGDTKNQGTASVLYLEDGPAAAGCPTGAAGCTATARAGGAGLFFAFPALGSTPNVVAFDETTGLPVWTAHVTTGGDGIRGTAVIDPEARRLYVVSGNNPHLVHALSVDTGVETTTGGWPATLSNATVSYNGVKFNSGSENQHGASLLLNGILYIPFGGQYGDGGNYLGAGSSR